MIITKKYRCSVCWGLLVEKYVDGEWHCVCAKDESHQGFVSAYYVERQRAISRAEAIEAYHNLAEIMHLDDNIPDSSATLYGDCDL